MVLKIRFGGDFVPRAFPQKIFLYFLGFASFITLGGADLVIAQIRYSDGNGHAIQNRQYANPAQKSSSRFHSSHSQQQVQNSVQDPPQYNSRHGSQHASQHSSQRVSQSPTVNSHLFQGDIRNEKLLDASTSPTAMKEAMRKIPWNQLSPQAKKKVQGVLAEKTLYRRLPQQSIFCEPILYHFFLEHPDVVVAMWEKLGVTQISLKENGRAGLYHLKESVGSVGSVEIVYRSDSLCVVYCKGNYTGPFIPGSIDGESVLVLHSVFEQDEDGEPYVVAQLDAFVSMQNFGVDVFAKLFSSMLGKIADNNFEQTLAFVGNTSEAAQSNPEIVKRLALRLESIPKPVRDEFIKVAYLTAQYTIDRMEGEPLENTPYGRNLIATQERYVREQQSQFEREKTVYSPQIREQDTLQRERMNRPLSAPLPHIQSTLPQENHPGMGNSGRTVIRNEDGKADAVKKPVFLEKNVLPNSPRSLPAKPSQVDPSLSHSQRARSQTFDSGANRTTGKTPVNSIPMEESGVAGPAGTKQGPNSGARAANSSSSRQPLGLSRNVAQNREQNPRPPLNLQQRSVRAADSPRVVSPVSRGVDSEDQLYNGNPVNKNRSRNEIPPGSSVAGNTAPTVPSRTAIPAERSRLNPTASTPYAMDASRFRFNELRPDSEITKKLASLSDLSDPGSSSGSVEREIPVEKSNPEGSPESAPLILPLNDFETKTSAIEKQMKSNVATDTRNAMLTPTEKKPEKTVINAEHLLVESNQDASKREMRRKAVFKTPELNR